VQVLLLTRGLPGSGKTTWAVQFVRENSNYKLLCKDDIRRENPGWKEPKVLAQRDELTRTYLSEGFSVIWGDTNINPRHIETATSIAAAFPGVEVQVNDSFMDVPIEECIRRDALRSEKVGAKVIKRMLREYQRYHRVVASYDPALPSAIMCDLDGTWALIHPKRSPYDASTSDQDLPNEPVIAVVNQFAMIGYTIIFCSGRQAKDEIPSRTHIEKYLAPGTPYELYMRTTGDSRPDDEVKLEMYDKYILGRYNIFFVLDDRDAVVAAWRSIGLTCFQVAPGDF